MIQKILIYSDRHKRWDDFETINNYLEMTSLISDDILNYVKENNITHVISTGDLYDKGYREVGPMYKDCLDDVLLTSAVNGNHYICIGNHLLLDRDSNPEMYLIQPDDIYKPRKEPLIKHKILKRVDFLKIGNVQISLFHHTRDMEKDYVRIREPGVRYHIGIYHDDCVVPVNVRQTLGIPTSTSNTYLANIYKDIDFAVVGHIHAKVGMTELYVGNKKVPIYIPGACTITQNRASEIHESVELPVITIDDENPDFPLTIDFVPFSLHVDVLKFYKPKVKKAPTLDETEQKELDSKVVSEKKITSYVDAEDYLMLQGLDNRSISYLRAASSGVIPVEEALQIAYNKVRY